MVAPAPLSYAERAKRAQNIRSPIAAPPPPQNILAPLPPPAPAPSVHVGVDTTSASSAASAASTASTAPSSAAVSAFLSDDTPNSSILLGTRASSPIPSTSFSPPSNNQNPLRPASKTVEQSRAGDASSSGQLAAKALSIVAAHSKPAPTPNVWSQRIERMSAARATAMAPSSSQTSNPGQNTLPSATPTGGSIAASAAGATPAPVSVTPVTPSPGATSSATTTSVTTEVWPEVGKSVLVSSTSTAGEDHGSANGEQEAGGGFESKGNQNNKGKAKSKWAPIPAAASAPNAAAAVTSPSSHIPHPNQPSAAPTSAAASTSATFAPASLHSDAQGLKVTNDKPKTHQIAASTSLAGKEDDPFVVKVRLAPAWAAAGASPALPGPAALSSASASTSGVSAAAAAAASPLGPAFSVTPTSAAVPAMSAEVWPEVGKSVLAASTSAVGDSLRVGVSQAGGLMIVAGEEQEVEGGSDGKGAKSKKGKAKSKWVPIPPAELQAAADAAAAAVRKAGAGGHSNAQGTRKANKSSKSNSSGNTNANNTNGTNTSAHNTPRTHSGRTSAVQSRVHSAQNSPRTQRGRRLPLEEGGIDATGPPSPAPGGVPPSIAPSQLPMNQQQQQQQHIPSTYQPQPQVPYPQQQQYSSVPAPPPNAPTPDQAYAAAHHNRHRSHPMQPVVSPSPVPAFQVSAPPFYPQSHHLPPAGDPTSPPAAAFQAANRAPVYPPPHGAYAPPHGPPPMYPLYAPAAFGYGAWQAPAAYGPLPPHQHQQGYAPLQYVEGPLQPQANALSVEEAAGGAVDGEVAQSLGDSGLEGGEQGALSPSSPSAASSLREKMMFGSIDLSVVPRESLIGDVSPVARGNGREGVKVNGESGSADVSMEKEEQNVGDQEKQGHAADGVNVTEGKQGKDSKSKADRRAKATNGTLLEHEKESARPSAGKPIEGIIPAVQAAQSVQAEIKWKFGTANNTPPVQCQQALPPAEEDALAPPHQQQQQQQPTEPSGVLQASSTMPAILAVDSNHSSGGLSPFAVALGPRGSASFARLPPALPLPSLISIGPISPGEQGLAFGDALVPSLPSAGTDSDLDVKDYGYGFGDASGSGYATALLREERLAREREYEVEREREREMMLWRDDNQQAATGGPPGFVGGLPTMDDGRVDEGVAAPEAGPSHGGYAPMREHGSWRGGGDGGHLNGTRGGRRGGAPFGSGPGGRGYGSSERGGGYGGRRGRGANGYSRGYGRGGYGRGGGAPGAVSHRPPPFTVTPPQHLHSLGPMNEPHQPGVGAPYYPPPRQISAPYIAPPLGSNGFDGYGPPPPLPAAVNGTPPVPQISPPVPVPLSPIAFPLDPTRYYLLGQLEYYLSPQNMAQDFFLRQRMDARGWIPISLIASFNRVKQLTMDAQFVKDVLTLSSLVQVRGSMVRMGGWERFVLPDAAPSSVEDQPLPHVYQNLGTYPDEHLHQQQQQTRQQSYQNQPIEQHGHQYYHQDGEPNSTAHWHVEVTEGPEGTRPLVNGHSSKSADTSHLDDDDEDDDEEEEEEEVVFVMGHEVGTWSPERGS